VENVFLIFGGGTIDMSCRQRKRERPVEFLLLESY
jgi:hypothetical protein